MIIDGNKIILTDDQATQHFGHDWPTVGDGGSIFFDGHEVYAERDNNGVFDQLVLTAVHDDTNFEAIYGMNLYSSIANS